MTEWTIVLWSAARQIAEEANLPRSAWPDDDVAPQDFFSSLRKGNDPVMALAYAAAALPKLEAIDWALHALPDLDEADPDYARRRLLRDAAYRWVGEPDDDNRRAMYDLADASSGEWPETLIGLAIFFSGGSIGPEENSPVTVDANICASLIGGALQAAMAEYIRSHPEFASRALDLADKVASRGREALATT
ncbi:hypothetical protein [Erythrobacter sp. JK5]|uniref:DUF6931 family protein n=1 Tax=Erythrobacter sp. JK5 TaxID=2829500 RepID=UPI001BA5CFD9|nr:hypothetical protein [Erythrobacter sp. JK5]QUL36779.1 hypothetical protein KDC96_10155 [Erythrobacter sp. JK5]